MRALFFILFVLLGLGCSPGNTPTDAGSETQPQNTQPTVSEETPTNEAPEVAQEAPTPAPGPTEPSEPALSPAPVEQVAPKPVKKPKGQWVERNKDFPETWVFESKKIRVSKTCVSSYDEVTVQVTLEIPTSSDTVTAVSNTLDYVTEDLGAFPLYSECELSVDAGQFKYEYIDKNLHILGRVLYRNPNS